LSALARQRFDLVLSDLSMPGNLKLELLHQGRAQWPETPLIVITGVPSLPTAVESLRLGIADYLLKPVSYRDLLSSIRRVLEDRPEPSPLEPAGDRRPAGPPRRFPEIIGDSPKMLELFEIMDRVVRVDTNVLITGESGTGKEIAARTIHRGSRRAGSPFQVVDCTTIPEPLFESILFGHAQGAFTGAVRDEPGLLRQVQGGTVFVDEIGELPAALQAKLLRVLQDQTFTPVGKYQAVQLDARFICATNRDLELEVNAGRFRRDLFYRLAVLHIALPPLRQRGDDVVRLARHFLAELRATNPRAATFSDEALTCFRRYHWPGNIRELRNVVERALALCRGPRIEVSDLPAALQPEAWTRPGNHPADPEPASHGQALGAAERDYLISLLDRCQGNVSQAARTAGLSRQGLHRLLKKHGITAGDYRQNPGG
jgi:two-component system response regulator HydG